ncbi:MAG: hypothetical protein JW759_08575 [Candidatus Coatesbacteria bacterium]|nr:hypothetical protein [Candidatus Coatesbacteria bacterium]
MIGEADASASFVANWLVKTKEQNPRSLVADAILDWTEDDVLDEQRLLASLLRIVDGTEEEEP